MLLLLSITLDQWWPDRDQQPGDLEDVEGGCGTFALLVMWPRDAHRSRRR
jgi:hypothetical protein